MPSATLTPAEFAKLRKGPDSVPPVNAPRKPVAVAGGFGFSFVIPGPPRTKKTSNRIVRAGAFNKILPSVQHEEWFAVAMGYAVAARQRAKAQGFQLPISDAVEVCATFYRDAERGDLVGYEQALADWMQEPKGKRQGAGLIVDDKLIRSWDGSRLLKDASNPRIEVTVTIL